MHITSLPGPYGLGTMGKAAYDFIDFLAAAGQSLWQILPLTPTGYGDSPYQSCSAFAGNEYLIDLPTLQQEGLLEPGEPEGFSWGQDPGRADFGLLYQSRRKVLALAYALLHRRTIRCRIPALCGILLFGLFLFIPLVAMEKR